MEGKKCKRVLAFTLVGALAFSAFGISSKAASKPVLKLNKKKDNYGYRRETNS